MGRTLITMARWFFAGTTVLILLMLSAALIRPSWYVRGGFGAGLVDGRVEVAWSNSKLTRQSNAWGLSSPIGSASILVAPRSAWLPSRSPAAIGTTSGAGATALFTLDVVYVPLWLPLAAGSLLTMTLFLLRGRRVEPGHCACGYDLRGGTGGKCPECGRLVESLAARVSRALAIGRRPTRAHLSGSCS